VERLNWKGPYACTVISGNKTRIFNLVFLLDASAISDATSEGATL
jgi:hypothetical protein